MRTLVFLLLCVSRILVAAAPLKLSETGLYQDISKKLVFSENRPYVPQYPLWTDGALKNRWVYLPKGKTIEVDNPDQWIFPTGTKFWKEFSFVSGSKVRRVETRYIEKVSEDEWLFASYLWNENESDAVVAPEDGVKDYYPLSSTLKHSIPSVSDCLRCHRKQGDGVLGFDALQLSTDRDPFALHIEKPCSDSLSLKQLIQEGAFSSVPKEFKDGAVRIPASTPVARSVYGYFHSNCSSCHSAMGSSMHVGMNLSFSVTAQTEAENFAFQSTVEKSCQVFQFPNEPKGIRVKRGDPAKSVLLRMMQGSGTEHMPPIGTVIQDVEAIQRIKEWISGL